MAALAGSDSLFGQSAAAKLARLQAELRPLAARYGVVVANPPYMGSSNMNKWLAGWVKERYPEEKRDLFAAFIARNLDMGSERAQLGFMTPYVWMFIGSYEKLRKRIISRHTITSLIQLEYSGFAGATVPICTFTLQKNHMEGFEGAYVRLADFPGADQQAPRVLEALANPDCGWFYRRGADAFEAIPGAPIAYWASDSMIQAFELGKPLESLAVPRQGLATGENARFVRFWWEPSLNRECFECPSGKVAAESGMKWFPYNKGGEYRKWYGNNDCVVNWENDGEEIRGFRDVNGKLLSRPQNVEHYFKPSITWSKISSGTIAFRYKPKGHIFDVAGTSIFADDRDLKYLHGACNSSVILQIASMLSPTLNFEAGQVATYPVIENRAAEDVVCRKVDELRGLSKDDWDAFETSWDYKKHPLL